MSTPDALDGAVITPEATLTEMNSTMDPHPHFPSTLGCDARFEIMLPRAQATVAEEIITNKTGEIAWHVRSAFAQLGIEAFGPEYSHTSLKNNILSIETVLADLRVKGISPTITALMQLLRTKKDDEKLLVAHAGLLPHAARLAGPPVQLPIKASYTLDAHFQAQDLKEMLFGSAREWIKTHRKRQNSMAETIAPDTFFLGGIDCREYNDFTVVLDSILLKDGMPTRVRHSRSPLIERGRSAGNGDYLRQVEIFNGQGIPMSIDDLRILARLYRTNHIATGA